MHALHSTKNVKLAKLRMMILASYVLHCSSEVHLIGENIYHRYNLIRFTQNSYRHNMYIASRRGTHLFELNEHKIHIIFRSRLTCDVIYSSTT